MKLFSFIVTLALAACVVLSFPGTTTLAGEAAPKGDDKAPQGSPAFYPSAAHPVGWRGDGSGCYPGATPPLTWSRTEKGEKKNIVWETKLPCYSWSTPIIVGEKVFTRSEPYDFICLNKNTGKILWIRSHPPFIAVTAEEKKANPAFAQVEPLVAELQKVNDAFVAQGWTKELYKQKYDLQKKINDLTAQADKKYKLPPDMYVESWGGYTGGTPCSDGEHVYFTSGDGITACYDLDGNRKWERYESEAAAWGEHGRAYSPTVVGDKLLVVGYALNKATGAEIWRPIYPAGQQPRNVDAYALFPFQAGGVDYMIYFGNFLRVSDGKIVVPCPADLGGGLVVTHDSTAYFTGGCASFRKWEVKPDNELSVTPLIGEEYNRVRFPSGANPAFTFKLDDTIATFYTASPVYYDGLLYCVGNAGRLVVVDTQKTKQADAIVYTAFPAFDFKNGFGRKSYGMGLCASPALAGKYIYMFDSAGCAVIMEPGREYKQIAKNTLDYTVPEGWEPKHWMGPHQEQTEASPVFEGGRIYVRGEQNLYCIGEK